MRIANQVRFLKEKIQHALVAGQAREVIALSQRIQQLREDKRYIDTGRRVYLASREGA